MNGLEELIFFLFRLNSSSNIVGETNISSMFVINYASFSSLNTYKVCINCTQCTRLCIQCKELEIEPGSS